MCGGCSRRNPRPRSTPFSGSRECSRRLPWTCCAIRSRGHTPWQVHARSSQQNVFYQRVRSAPRRRNEARRVHRSRERVQAWVLSTIARWRTAELGGHVDACRSCGFARPASHSCRNRHCPKCQALRQATWITARTERLLPFLRCGLRPALGDWDEFEPQVPPHLQRTGEA